MEHRWGERIPMSLKVRLVSRPGAIGSGRLRDVSLSGAFVQTDLKLPVFTHVAIEFKLNQGNVNEIQEVAACVARRVDDGLGVEWCEFAPQVIRDLLAGTHAQTASLPALRKAAAELAKIRRRSSS
jgi:PilZ domain